MPTAAMPLTDLTIRNAKPGSKPLKLTDGDGLHLLVTPAGGKLWRMQYRFGGKQKQLTFGAYPAVSLSAARQKREEARRLLAEQTDPAEQERIKRLTRKISAANTFDAIADEWLDKARREGRAPATLAKIEWLLDFARPTLGRRPITDISAAEVLATLRKVEVRGRFETARRLRSTIGSVFRFAIATARATDDPTFALRGALTTPNVKHRAALTDPIAFGGLLRAVESFDGQPTTRSALKLMALLFPRPGELRAAEWDEFDLAHREWVIPAARTKMRRTHRVPLGSDALLTAIAAPGASSLETKHLPCLARAGPTSPFLQTAAGVMPLVRHRNWPGTSLLRRKVRSTCS